MNWANWQREEPEVQRKAAAFNLDGTSRMMREYQVRICERLGVKFPGPTRHRRPGPWDTLAKGGVLNPTPVRPPRPRRMVLPRAINGSSRKMKARAAAAAAIPQTRASSVSECSKSSGFPVNSIAP